MHKAFGSQVPGQEMEWESDVVQSRMETPRAPFLKRQWKINGKRRNGENLSSSLSSELALFHLSLLLPCAHVDLWTPHSQHRVTLQHVWAMQWRGLCSAKASPAAATTLTTTQKPHRPEPSTATGLFRPVKVITRHKRMTVHVHEQCLFSKPVLSKFYLAVKSYLIGTPLCTLNVRCFKVIKIRPHPCSSINQTNFPRWQSSDQHRSRESLLWGYSAQIKAEINPRTRARRTQWKLSLLHSIVLQENRQSAVSH